MAQHRTISTRRPSQKWDGKSCWSSLAVFDIISCMRHLRYIFFQLFLFQIFHHSFSVWCSLFLFTVSIKFMFVVVVLLNFSSLFSYPKKIALWHVIATSCSSCNSFSTFEVNILSGDTIQIYILFFQYFFFFSTSSVNI